MIYKLGTMLLFGLLVSAGASAGVAGGDSAGAAASIVPAHQELLDITWILVASCLVFFMQAGFALMETGMARAKNSINVAMKNFTDMCFGAVAFWLVGYGLMFGTNTNGWIGTDHFMPTDVSGKEFAFFFFQIMFAATAATIVSGALAERIHFGSYIVASIVVTAVIYPVFGSWAWGSYYSGSGWLKAMGYVDFAGSSVVHVVGGWCALAGCLVLGPRLGKFAADGTARNIPGHNLTLVAFGGFVLWLGWMGFNGGSTLTASASVGKILVNTHLAGAAGAIGAISLLWLLRKPLLMTTVINASLGGLVAVTAGCATMSPTFALLTGFLAGGIVVLSLDWVESMGVDDVVGAVSVHGVCGTWGIIAAGLFYEGDMFSIGRLMVQGTGVVVAFFWAFGAGYVMFKVIDMVMGLRASSQDEQRGLDFSEHYEIGYPEFQQDLIHRGKE